MPEPYLTWKASGESCPSCAALNGQVHPASVWALSGLVPGAPSLYCGASCHCELIEAGEEERGDLAAVPLRGAALLAASTFQDAGEFAIVAISEGVGNGWTFSADVLKSSVPLWDNRPIFIDHAASVQPRLASLAGYTTQPVYSESRRAIVVKVRPVGPQKGVLEALRVDSNSFPSIGFSADLLFIAGPGRVVERITHVNSVDAVLNPARGGAFLPVAAQFTKGNLMPGDENTTAASSNQPSIEEIAAENARLQAEARERDAAEAIRVSMCETLLETSLGAAGLPQSATERVRAQFAGRAFDPAELKEAISNMRSLVAELAAPAAIRGTPQISGMFSSEDQLQLAVDDLLGVTRRSEQLSQSVHRLRGIQELYVMLTGDSELRGGFDPQRVGLATTADFSGLVKNALNKAVLEHWANLGRAGYSWWERIVTVMPMNSLQSLTGIIVGSISALPSIAEGAPYTELPVGDSAETAEWTKYGGYIPLTLELIDRDETAKLRAYPRELANAGLRRISSLIAAIFTANSGTGPDMADGGKLFNATAQATAGGHNNLTTTALSASQWESVCAQVYGQKLLVKNETGMYAAGAQMAINPRYLLVPRALQLTGMKILYPSLENAANIYSENQQRGQPGDVITVPEWTDATDWAAVCDPLIAPSIVLAHRFGVVPEIFVAGGEYSPAVFTNDEHRIKVRHFLSVLVGDYRPLHKANVAG